MRLLTRGVTDRGAQAWTHKDLLSAPAYHSSAHRGLQHADRKLRGPAPQSASRKSPEQVLSVEDFSLATAVAMGAASFEAYNPPYSMHGIKEVDDNESETVYMQRPFLDRLMAGVLQVHLRRAEGLKYPKDKHDKEVSLNPRFLISAGPSCGWSSTVSMSTDPIYGETMFLYVRHPVEEPLHVKLLHNTSNPNQDVCEMGRVTFPNIAELCNGDYHELALDLEGEDGPAGKVFLGAQFLRHSEEDDVLTDLPVLATGQMMSDDWGWGDAPAERDWFNDDDYEWRSSLIQIDEMPVLSCREDGLDITGLPAGTGNPLDRPPWKMWKDFREAIRTRELTSNFEPFAFLAHVPTDSEVWVYVSDKHEICLAFRGTASPADMLKDAVFDLAAFAPGNRPKSRQPEEVAEEVDDKEIEQGGIGGIFKIAKLIDSIPGVPQLGKLVAASSGRGGSVMGKPPLTGWVKAQGLMVYSYEHNERWVHNGFLQTYTAVQPPLLRMLDEIMDNGEEEQWHIYCTGHSMGGALACLAAYEISSLDFQTVPKPKISVYTFGSPRVGNIPFAEDYDKQVPATWRVSNENDLVTRIPSLLGYRHVGMEVKIGNDGTVSVSQVSSDQVREGTTFGDMLPRIKEGLFGEDKKLKEEFKELVQGEWEVSQAIMRGHAIQEHMEDKYHDILKACVDAGGDACKPKLKDVDEPLQA